ncbi:MAG: hypothetical protein KTR32_20455 [Granulosicoccus sp.]|nr:hypothetical protein [Granulosicoccus sp.]
MLKMSLQVFILVIVPMMTLVWFLNSGNSASLVYGAGVASRELQLEAKRNGDVKILLNDSSLLKSNFLDFEFDKREVLQTESLDYHLDCVKQKVSPRLQSLTCLFDSKRGEVFRFNVVREGFLRVDVFIRPD